MRPAPLRSHSCVRAGYSKRGVDLGFVVCDSLGFGPCGRLSCSWGRVRLLVLCCASHWGRNPPRDPTKSRAAQRRLPAEAPDEAGKVQRRSRRHFQAAAAAAFGRSRLLQARARRRPPQRQDLALVRHRVRIGGDLDGQGGTKAFPARCARGDVAGRGQGAF